jgi:hypothetical protein
MSSFLEKQAIEAFPLKQATSPTSSPFVPQCLPIRLFYGTIKEKKE